MYTYCTYKCEVGLPRSHQKPKKGESSLFIYCVFILSFLVMSSKENLRSISITTSL